MNASVETNHRFLQLMQLADSALPIGVTAHSFGVEALVADDLLTVNNLETFLGDYLSEAGVVDGAFCRAAYELGTDLREDFNHTAWIALNDHLSALRPARESRTASTTLGRRFATLVLTLSHHPLLRAIVSGTAPFTHTVEIHYATSFGICGRTLGFEVNSTVLAYLQMSVNGIVSACQRLLPLGQSEAARLLWEIKPLILEALRRSHVSVDDVSCSLQLPELASLRHPTLATRLFIS